MIFCPRSIVDRETCYQLVGNVEMEDSYFGTFRASGKRGRGAAQKTKIIISMQVGDDNKPNFANMNVVLSVDGENISKTANENILKSKNSYQESVLECFRSRMIDQVKMRMMAPRMPISLM